MDAQREEQTTLVNLQAAIEYIHRQQGIHDSEVYFKKQHKLQEARRLRKAGLERLIQNAKQAKKLARTNNIATVAGGPSDLQPHMNAILQYMTVNEGSPGMVHSHKEELSLWKRANICFEPLLLKLALEGNRFESSHLKEWIQYAKNTKELVDFNLSLNRANQIVLEGRGFRSSEVQACHVSSGSMEVEGYRYVNFVTKSGSIYHGSGLEVKDKLGLMKEIIVLENPV
jgi:hypothetical protein